MKTITLPTHDTNSLRLFSYFCCKSALVISLAIMLQPLASTKALHLDNLGNETDYSALLAIKSQLVDHPAGVLSSWNHSLHHCSWEGVICGRKHNRVVALELDSKGLVGTVSPSLGNLSFLRQINLANNSLHGQIASEIGHLVRLRKLVLDHNKFIGEVPANLSCCKNLKTLMIINNMLEGKLPRELGALSKLEMLSVAVNNFTGQLFEVIYNLTSLRIISAGRNSFTGTIPNDICRLQTLNTLYASMNSFHGIFPNCIFNISSLRYVEFSVNQLQGHLPSDIGLILPHIKILNFAYNNFSGSVPISISNLTNLEELELAENQFTGRMTYAFTRLHNLQSLQLGSNQLVGDISFILSSLVNCSNLQLLDLNDNFFTGILPKSVANLSTALTFLSLGDNAISGVLPSGITNLVNLSSLLIGGCNISGSIPSDIGRLQNLEWFDLRSNRLRGPIPNSLGNLSRLSNISLDQNKLQGSVPPSLGSCQNLLFLFLSYNELNGSFPNELFTGSAKFVYLNLSGNNLEGSLHLEFSKQLNLVKFQVSDNKFSGTLPDDLSNCRSLQYLEMGGNSFHGSIPLSFTSLDNLLLLDLSRNNLSGPFPAYMSIFPLTYLNLSFNNLEGRVPTNGVFANVSAIDLVGNSRLCGGVPILHLPKCAENETKGRMKSRVSPVVLKVIIPSISALVGGVALAIGLYLMCIRHKRKTTSVGSALGEDFVKVSYNMLLKATDNFSSENLLGTGTFGSVFKGILDGKTVAVKLLNLQSRGASKSFMAECKTLRNTRHRNLLGIITACSSIDFQRNDFKALVYEFMPNGNLDKLLHEAGNLTLSKRLDIALDVGHALNYLHNECDITIVHCDLKPSNILLDNDMVAHVGDFGLAKFLALPRHPNQSSSIGLRGTVGYAAPEYGMGCEESTSDDLYSYGILLLELMTGKRPVDNMFSEDFNLHMYAEAALPDQVSHIMDPILIENEFSTEEEENDRAIQAMFQQKAECVISIITIGVACSKHLPHERMKITDAISKLIVARNKQSS